jgi:hypothetical protein
MSQLVLENNKLQDAYSYQTKEIDYNKPNKGTQDLERRVM